MLGNSSTRQDALDLRGVFEADEHGTRAKLLQAVDWTLRNAK